MPEKCPDARRESFRKQLDHLADEYERIIKVSSSLQQENTALKQRLMKKNSFGLRAEDTDSLNSISSSWKASAAAHRPELFKQMQWPDNTITKQDRKPSKESDALSGSKDLGVAIDDFSGYSAESDDYVPDEIPLEITCAEMQERFVSLDRTESASKSGSENLYIDFQKQSSDCTVTSVSTPSEKSSKGRAVDYVHTGNQQQALPIFPKWFDPGLIEDDHYDHQVLDNVLSLSEWEPDPNRIRCCLLKPVGRLRLTWDLIAFLCLLSELWVTPFELFFLGNLETPTSLMAIQHSITAFFTIDIILNFMTGFIEEDRTIMERQRIVKHYLQSWFWIDLVATVPFDVILMSMGGGFFSMARLGKASKAVKTLRYLKLLRAVRLVKLTAQANTFTQHFALVDNVRVLVGPVQGLLFLLLFAHIHGCAWQVVQNDSEDVETVGEALRRYFQGFWWAYCAVTVGSLGPSTDDFNPWLAFVEMTIASERLLMLVFASMKVIFKSLSFLDDARKIQAHNQVLKYLRQHRVSFQTQIQVLYSLRDTGQAKKHQKYAEELFANELPQELQRTICHELWGSRLTSLGLIREVGQWHRDFVRELSLLVFEEVFPSRSVVFRVGDAASAAYHIIRGELIVGYIVGMSLMPEFTKGMWVGESALASNLLRRSATIVTKSITSVMVVPAERFQSLLSRFGVTAQYQEFCSEHLWKGLCGRCGVLGEHFSDSCNKEKNPNTFLSRISVESRKSFTAAGSLMSSGNDARWGTEDPYNSDVENDLGDMNVEMKRYLVTNNLEFLFPIFRDMQEIPSTLDKMLASDMIMLKRKVQLAGFELTKENEFALTEPAITQFRLKNAARVSRTLFRRVSRLHHLIFLSHYKLEAGTEAALMRTELEQAIEKDPGNPGHYFDEPVFLDSDNLNNLEDLQIQVKHTHNVVVLLTKDVLTRPWVLVEIVTAMREGCRILLVKVTKAGCEFEFPEDHFYTDIENGSYLNEEAQDVIHRCGITMHEVSDTLRHVFQKIAVPYSPHKATSIRVAEVTSLLRQCQLKDT